MNGTWNILTQCDKYHLSFLSTKTGESMTLVIPQDVLTKSEVRSQKFLAPLRRYRTEVVFETEIYAPFSKTMRLKRRGFRPNYFR